MKLHLTQSTGGHLITGYGPHWVAIDATRHDHSVIVLPNQLISPWAVPRFESLTLEQLEMLVALSPELVLLGTGARQHFLQPTLARLFTEAGIGLECMDTPAACRTYNILMAEGRHVAAALIL